MERKHMNHIRELIHRLRAGESQRRIAKDLHLSRTTVGKYRAWAEAQGYLDGNRPVPDDATLAAALVALHKFTPVLKNRLVTLGLLAITLTYAFFTESFLLAAIAGLLLRPIPARYLERGISVLYHIIVFVVGMALYSYGVDLRLGILLAVVEFFVVQPLTALIMFNGTAIDVFRIAFAQQNGLTTLLMGIAFESMGVRVLHILLPAIVAVNIFNLAVNKIYSWKESRGLIT